MQQNATLCSLEQVYAKDVTLYARIVVTVDPSHRRNEVSRENVYARLFPEFGLFKFCQDIHLFLCSWHNKKVSH